MTKCFLDNTLTNRRRCTCASTDRVAVIQKRTQDRPKACLKRLFMTSLAGTVASWSSTFRASPTHQDKTGLLCRKDKDFKDFKDFRGFGCFASAKSIKTLVFSLGPVWAVELRARRAAKRRSRSTVQCHAGPRVAVIGAGPVGLATALALRKEGLDDVSVYERSAELRLLGCNEEQCRYL